MTPSRILEGFLSPERLRPYRSAVGGDLDAAIRLYEWNTQVGAGFLEVLGHLEVVLRNALDGQLRAWHAARHLAGEWYDDPLGWLEPHRAEDIREARDRLRRDAKAETPGRVVAELSFGFWRFLLGRRYQTSLWAQVLRHAFPHLQPQRRSDVYEPIQELNGLRNRIAHHEPIHHLELPRLHNSILLVGGYLDPEVRAWIARVSRVPTLLSTKP
ncbi:MAG: hypothetical protein JF886_08430 [Candidatus Dormibacteraeota bacterium]|uniref:CAAX protease n=1 Tax=Candidatus Aeolococcus gillhamiae TaxID=3127015 RepID=A0A934N603_9BACT|nr:hypothetical protein [Candidatus Dormibacteraeota bacterium]